MTVGSIDGSHGFAERLWNMLSEEGVWGVPRTGLLFCKRGGQLILIEQMPHEVGMPMPPEALREAQNEDFVGITDMFAAIGVEVVRANGCSTCDGTGVKDRTICPDCKSIIP